MKTIRSRAYKDRIAGLDDSIITLFSSDGPLGEILVSGSADGKVRSWNLQDKSKLFKHQISKPEGSQDIGVYMFLNIVVVAGYMDGDLATFDLRTANLLTLMKGH